MKTIVKIDATAIRTAAPSRNRTISGEKVNNYDYKTTGRLIKRYLKSLPVGTAVNSSAIIKALSITVDINPEEVRHCLSKLAKAREIVGYIQTDAHSTSNRRMYAALGSYLH